MTHLTEQRCFNHLSREAVARCPECRRHFCRECVTEHEDRVLCSACLAALHTPRTGKKRRRGTGVLLVNGAISFLLIWLVFYSLGQLLLLLPSSFHDGTLWRDAPRTKL